MTEIILPSQTVPAYATLSAFPLSAADGALAVAKDTDTVYVFNAPSHTWVPVTGGGGGGGTVTSVAVTVPSGFSVSGSPVTTAGTIAISANSEPANEVYASPNGSSGVPSFRALVPADIPNLNNYVVNEFTLSPTDITNKFVTLSSAPVNPTLTILNVIDGIVQQYGPDFTVSGSILSWSSLFLDGVLVSGDILIVQFY